MSRVPGLVLEGLYGDVCLEKPRARGPPEAVVRQAAMPGIHSRQGLQKPCAWDSLRARATEALQTCCTVWGSPGGHRALNQKPRARGPPETGDHVLWSGVQVAMPSWDTPGCAGASWRQSDHRQDTHTHTLPWELLGAVRGASLQEDVEPWHLVKTQWHNTITGHPSGLSTVIGAEHVVSDHSHERFMPSESRGRTWLITLMSCSGPAHPRHTSPQLITLKGCSHFPRNVANEVVA